MDGITHLLVMSLDAQRFALPLSSVDRVFRAVELTPLPEGPSYVLGVVNVQGRIITAINLRQRCRLPERDIEPTDQFVIVHTSAGSAALVVDHTEVMDCKNEMIVRAIDALPSSNFVQGILRQDDGLILVCEVNSMLSTLDTGVTDSKGMLTAPADGT